MTKLIKTLLILITIIKIVNSYGESDSQGNPNHFERDSLNLLNLVRMFPSQYKANYMAGYTNLGNMFSSYPAVAPVLYNNTMNRMSKAHSAEMATLNCFQHNDCANSSSTGNRFTKWLSCTRGWSENIAAGSQTGLIANNQLLCDSQSGNKLCTNDGVADGHRKNIMGKTYQMVGVGHFYTTGSTYKHYVTQDFSYGNCGVTISSPKIYSAYHTFNPSTNKIPQFIAIYYSTTIAAQSMSIVLNGSTFPMVLTYGNSNGAAYTYTPPSTFAVSCQQYYFTATDSTGANTRYPDIGSLNVVKDSTTTTCSSWSGPSALLVNNIEQTIPQQVQVVDEPEQQPEQQPETEDQQQNNYFDYYTRYY